MLKYIIKRMIMLIPVLVGVSILVFSIIHLIPGDPARVMLGERANAQSIAMLEEKLGLNQPLYMQYYHFMSNVLHGDLGTSILTNEKVSRELMRAFAATIELTILAMIIAIVVGVTVGTLAAVKQYSWFDNLSMVGALLGVSMPIFWLGLLMIWLFSYLLGWFPASGRIDAAMSVSGVTGLYMIDTLLSGNIRGFLDTLWHLVMPSTALSTIPMAIIARMTRSSMLEVMQQDYIRTARAKGLTEKIVIFKHAIRNAFLPVITIIGLEFGLLLGGAVLTETVFAYPGLGRRMFLAIMARDYPIVQGGILLIAVCFVFVNLIVDVLYTYIDPRIKIE